METREYLYTVHRRCSECKSINTNERMEKQGKTPRDNANALTMFGVGTKAVAWCNKCKCGTKQTIIYNSLEDRDDE